MLLSRITHLMTVMAAVRDALARAEPAWVLLALAIYIASVPLVAFRWRTMVTGVTGAPAPLGSLVLATLASSFVNNVTPAARVSGEACRVIALVRMRVATTAQATAAAAYERLTEAPAVIVLAMAALFVAGRLELTSLRSLMSWAVWIPGSTARVAIVSGLVIVSALAFAARRVLISVRRRAADRWRQLRLIGVAPSTLGAAAALSGAVWLLDVTRLAVVAAAFHAPIGPLQAATLAAITIVAGWVPTIGGLGAVEGGLVAGLVSFGVTPADAVAITIVERIMSYGIPTVAGAGALSLLGGRSLWRAVRAPLPEAAAS
jgi:uncharacterized protein (TIRG00374 family)